jgi:hypothetical protein
MKNSMTTIGITNPMFMFLILINEFFFMVLSLAKYYESFDMKQLAFDFYYIASSKSLLIMDMPGDVPARYQRIMAKSDFFDP